MHHGLKLTHPRYEKVIILSLIHNLDTTDIIRNKALKNYSYPVEPEIIYIFINPNGQLTYDQIKMQAAFANTTNKLRIYLRGHCCSGSNTLQDDHRHTITAENLAKYLAGFLQQTTIIDNSKIRISLTGCGAGIPSSSAKVKVTFPCINNSFAARFLYWLNHNGINCAIAARNGVVKAVNDGGVPRLSISTSIKHSYGNRDNAAKVIYEYEDGLQMIKTAYLPKSAEPKQWRAEVIDTINDSIRRTPNRAKKEGLCRLVSDLFVLQTDREISAFLRRALADHPECGYRINMHTDFFGYGNTRTAHDLRKLLV